MTVVYVTYCEIIIYVYIVKKLEKLQTKYEKSGITHFCYCINGKGVCFQSDTVRGMSRLLGNAMSALVLVFALAVTQHEPG